MKPGVAAAGRAVRRRLAAGARHAACLAGLFATAGCVSALREAPPVDVMAGAPPAGATRSVEALLQRAAEHDRTRDLAGVREAAALYLQAAAADPARSDALEAAARCGVWLADHETDAAARREAATRAVQASQWCIRRAPESASCVFWLGASLGVQARERPSTGLSALPQIEAAFKDAAARAPDLDEGGPDRALALLYLRAPGWPAGPGDPEAGLLHARRAVTISGLYPPNLLVLAEALAASGQTEASRSAYRRALELARGRSGEDPDAPEWIADAEKALARGDGPAAGTGRSGPGR